MKNFKKRKSAIIALTLAFLTLFTVSFSACGTKPDNVDEKHVCESVCVDCKKCTDEACADDACKQKCDCVKQPLYDVNLDVRNADVKLTSGGKFNGLKAGETVSFTAKELDGYVDLSVKVNGTKLTAVNGVYSFVVDGTVNLQVSAKLNNGDKVLTKRDVTLELYDNLPHLVIKCSYQNYAIDELIYPYLDLENYPEYGNKNYNDWSRREPSLTVTTNGEDLCVYADVSELPEDTLWIPHFLFSNSLGDLKVYESIGKTLIYQGKEYVISNQAYSLTCLEVVKSRVFLPSDVTPPTFSSISNYQYYKTTEVPRIDIATKGGKAIDDQSLIKGYKGLNHDVPEYDYVDATVTVSNCDGYELNSVAASVKVRGNYSSTYPKRPIRIKFDKKQKMCGLNGGEKFKNWVLLAEYKDSSMLRNSVAFYLGNSILESEGYYCSDFRYVEVYLNGTYNGLYVLCEQQESKEGQNRIDLPEALDPDDEENADNPNLKNVKIGYLIEYDGYYFNEKDLERFTIEYGVLQRESSGKYTPSQKGFTIKSDVYYVEQRNFIKKCVQNIWDIVYDATYGDHYDLTKNPFYTLNANGEKVKDTSIKTTREAVEKVIDVKSLVDVYIINEICEDMDIGWSSFYMSLDMSDSGNRKLTFVAPWDFDSALGNIVTANDSLFGANSDNPWLTVLVKQGWFWTHVDAKWNALKTAGTFDGVIGMIDYYANSYASYYATNFNKWKECMGNKIEDSQTNLTYTFKTQKDSANYLKTWLQERITNLDRLFSAKAALYKN